MTVRAFTSSGNTFWCCSASHCVLVAEVDRAPFAQDGGANVGSWKTEDDPSDQTPKGH